MSLRTRAGPRHPTSGRAHEGCYPRIATSRALGWCDSGAPEPTRPVTLSSVLSARSTDNWQQSPNLARPITTVATDGGAGSVPGGNRAAPMRSSPDWHSTVAVHPRINARGIHLNQCDEHTWADWMAGTIAAGVYGWLSTLPIWQQDIARRAARAVTHPADELDALEALLKNTFGCEPPVEAQDPVPLTIDDLPDTESGPVAQLVSFGKLEGVGLVVQDGEIPFVTDGITVIYGANAAGKTSYVRGLKAVCRTIDRASRIRGNVYQEGDRPPTANVQFSLDGVIQQLRTPLVGDVFRLPGVTVFDAACAELYVNDDNEFEYVPAPLRVLTRMASLQHDLRARIAQEQTTLQALTPNFDGIHEDSNTARALRSLTGSSHDPDLTDLSRLSEDERGSVDSLRAAIAAADASTARSDAAAAKADASEATQLASALEALAMRCGSTAALDLSTAARADAAAKEAVRLAAAEFAQAPVPNIGSDPWKLLWDAAKSFNESVGVEFPPTPGERCPLCQQVVNAEAADRMAHFESHVTSEVSAAAISAAGRLATLLADWSPTHVDACRTPLLIRLKELLPDLGSAIDTYLRLVEGHMRTACRTPGRCTPLERSPETEVELLREWAAARLAHCKQLEEADDAVKLAELRRTLRDVEARIMLQARIEEFEGWRVRLRNLGRLKQLHSALATNKVSMEQRRLSEALIGDALRKALDVELAALRCSHLPVSVRLTAAVAATSVGLRLLSAEPTALSAVVSEGEGRAIALAFFLAELSMMPPNAGIVVDDPVSSLDDERRTVIARRLAAEAEDRQVIVFTHDLPFLAELEECASGAGVSLEVRGMWRLGQEVGRVDQQPPFRTLKLKQRIGVLKERVAQWDSPPAPASQDEAWQRVEAFYKDLRTSWERAVEERLFQGVVERMQRDVKTLKLKHVVITQELIDMVNAGMARASFFVHDEPVGAAVALPGKLDLARDLEALETFAARVRPH